ncbi:MAG: hypothetical protein NW216_07070 [Hyphomicrobium sp.]|nr:hypothetical protein [Hyphomicrobium sp.]
MTASGYLERVRLAAMSLRGIVSGFIEVSRGRAGIGPLRDDRPVGPGPSLGAQVGECDPRLDDRAQWSAVTDFLDDSIRRAQTAKRRHGDAAEQLEVTAYAIARIRAEIAPVLLDAAVEPHSMAIEPPARTVVPFERRRRLAA